MSPTGGHSNVSTPRSVPGISAPLATRSEPCRACPPGRTRPGTALAARRSGRFGHPIVRGIALASAATAERDRTCRVRVVDLARALLPGALHRRRPRSTKPGTQRRPSDDRGKRQRDSAIFGEGGVAVAGPQRREVLHAEVGGRRQRRVGARRAARQTPPRTRARKTPSALDVSCAMADANAPRRRSPRRRAALASDRVPRPLDHRSPPAHPSVARSPARRARRRAARALPPPSRRRPRHRRATCPGRAREHRQVERRSASFGRASARACRFSSQPATPPARTRTRAVGTRARAWRAAEARGRRHRCRGGGGADVETHARDGDDARAPASSSLTPPRVQRHQPERRRPAPGLAAASTSCRHRPSSVSADSAPANRRRRRACVVRPPPWPPQSTRRARPAAWRSRSPCRPALAVPADRVRRVHTREVERHRVRVIAGRGVAAPWSRPPPSRRA